MNSNDSSNYSIDNKSNQESSQNDEKANLIKKIKHFEKKPWVFLVRKRKLTYLIIVFLLIYGLFTVNSLPRELNPEVEIPIAVVSTVFPGASPLDVEKQVTDEIESEIADIEGIKKIDSSSSFSVSSIVVEFEADQDLKESIRKLKDEVDKVQPDLQEDALASKVTEISIDDEPIVIVTITSQNGYELSDLKVFAENVKDQVKGVGFVSEVNVVGGQDKVVKVDINQEKLAQRGLSLGEVINKLESNNVNFPVGSVKIDDFNYTIRTEGEFRDAQEVGGLIIGSVNNKPILLEDVAEVKDDLAKETSRSRFSIAGGTSTPAVSLQIFKKTGGDITKVVKEIRKNVEEARGTAYPEDVRVEVTRDFSDFIIESIDDLTNNGLGTVIIILLLLFVFLGSREALIAGAAVPFSFFISFIMMSLLGESLNFLSLFSLVLALGLLVDSAIVIVEGMFNKVSKFGLTGYEAAIATISEYGAPLLSGMLTTVAAFFPLMFVKGIFGQFMKAIPIVVNTTLIAALFVALTIIPAIGASFIKPRRKGDTPDYAEASAGKNEINKKPNIFRKLCRKVRFLCKPKVKEKHWATTQFQKLSEGYHKMMPKLLSSAKYRRMIIGGVWLIFFLSLALPMTGLLKVQSFVDPDSEFFFVSVKTPNGTTLDKTDQSVRKVEEVLRQEKEIINFVSGVNKENRAFLEVNLTKKEERKEKSTQIVSRVRKELDKITQAEVEIVQEETGPPGGAPIEARLIGPDLIKLEEIAEEIKNQLASLPTVINAKTSAEASAGELVFVPNKDVLAQKGISAIQIAGELRNGITRHDDLEISAQGEEIRIDVGYEENSLQSVSDLNNIAIKNFQGETWKLSELGELKIMPGLAVINHRDEERVVSITADSEGGNPTEITGELREMIAQKINLPVGYRLDFGGEEQELNEIFQDMFLKMIIGVLLILFILVTQFNSYRQVLIILFTIPLAMIGVFLGMTLGRFILDIPSFIGIVSLTGIVVNNAIILIDQINRERASGRDVISACQEAGYIRLRPIILTTITTVFGLLPLSITQPEWRNMGFTIIFGLLFSTVLTLFIVPTMFVSFYKKTI